MVIPLCRCRVLYVGSAIPTVTKDGLQGIQQPLRERYPIDESHDTKGIDSWLSVWSNGLLLEYIDGERRSETAFFPITSLHYCAAVRYVNLGGYSVESGGGERFLPLDSPFASLPDSPHPPIFAGIFRRTTGVRVLECHAFICTNAKAANALVRCCFHAYADSIYLKMDDKIPGLKAIKEASRSSTPHSDHLQSADEENERDIIRWSEQAIGKQTWQRRQQSGDYDTASISSSLAARYRNHKDAQPPIDGAGTGTLKSTAGGALVPYANGAGGGIYHHHQRRSGSEVDLASATRQQHHHNYHHEGYPPPMGMFPHGPPPFMPPPFHPPMGMMPGGGPPPPFAMMPPFGPPPPHMMIPPGMRMPPPPPPFFAGPPFLPPHPHHPMFGGMMPPPFMGPPGRRGGPPQPPESSSGPIITGPESVYGTLPRNRSGAFEEPIYMPGAHNGAYPPQASYQPSTFPPDQYDAYYDSYRQHHHRSPHTKHKAPSSTSGGRAPESSHYWDAYESGIYRKPYINEKAFGAAMQSESVVLNSTTTNVNNTNGRTTTTTTTAEIVRPETPPVDYENGGGINGLHLSDTKGRTAVY